MLELRKRNGENCLKLSALLEILIHYCESHICIEHCPAIIQHYVGLSRSANLRRVGYGVFLADCHGRNLHLDGSSRRGRFIGICAGCLPVSLHSLSPNPGQLCMPLTGDELLTTEYDSRLNRRFDT